MRFSKFVERLVFMPCTEIMIMNSYFKISLMTVTTMMVCASFCLGQDEVDPMTRFQQNTHQVVLDDKGKIIPWTTPQSHAYDVFLRRRWDFIKHYVPNCPGAGPAAQYPLYYFYCAYRTNGTELIPDTWMNDIGEKVPNWFESARLYYAYSGDSSVMTIVRGLADYAIAHGTSAAGFAWPSFPHTTSNAGDTEFSGFTSAKRFALHEVQVDHAAEIGLTYYRLWLYAGDEKYKNAAIVVANTLADRVSVGSATHSPWPYRVILDTGEETAPYGANWTGAYMLLRQLRDARIGRVDDYAAACEQVRRFILQFPLKTGYWTDGHSDTDVKSNTYKSNLSASNFALFLFDYPDFDAQWKASIPSLIAWTEKYFVERSAPGEPSNMWGANIVGEQDDFMFKMDYQTARYGATCARWFAVTGDDRFKEKAYRALNWVTYCSDSVGRAFESPLSKDISNWWSDCYGEGPRMFYHAFAAVPEWAPPGEDHILYSEGILKNVHYAARKVRYYATSPSGVEYLRLSFRPKSVTLDNVKLRQRSDLAREGYVLRDLGGGDYSMQIRHNTSGQMVISANTN